jgi:hypothetical protein
MKDNPIEPTKAIRQPSCSIDHRPNKSMGRGKSDRKKQNEAYRKRLAASAISRQQRETERFSSSWTSRLQFVETTTTAVVGSSSKSDNNGGSQHDDAAAVTASTTRTTTAHHVETSSPSSSSSFCTVISWNILAEQYCNKRSQNHLPERAQSQIFDPKRRRRHWQRALTALLGGDDHHDGNNDHNKLVDVVCLQEVDRLVEDIAPCLSALGYQNYAASPTVNGGGAGGKVDAVAIFIRDNIWSIVEEKLVRFDDLATMMQHQQQEQQQQQQPCSGRQGEEDAKTRDSSSNGGNGIGIDDNDDNDDNDGSPTERRRQQKDAARKTNAKTTTKTYGSSSSSSQQQRHLPGLSYSFLRRNVALLVRLRHQVTGRTVVIANAHLYWNPSYEYVKVRCM